MISTMTATDSHGVPILDRRRGKRYLTLKNIGISTLAVLAVLAVFNIRSEMRNTTSDEEFGRLYGREMKKAPAPTPSPVVGAQVAPVDEAAGADPFHLDAARREQMLGTPTLEPVPLLEPTATADAIVPRPSQQSDVTIVGGPEGVALLQNERARPVLGGGFGRRNQ